MEILTLVLTGRSQCGQPLLGVRWRWAAARVCLLWRAIIDRAPAERCRGSRRQARLWYAAQRGRVLCLSACIKWVRNGAGDGLVVLYPLAVALARLTLGTVDGFRAAEKLANAQTRCAPDLGPLDHNLCCALCDDYGLASSCILWRYAI